LFIELEEFNDSIILVAKKDILIADYKQLQYLFKKSLKHLKAIR